MVAVADNRVSDYLLKKFTNQKFNIRLIGLQFLVAILDPGLCMEFGCAFQQTYGIVLVVWDLLNSVVLRAALKKR